MERSLKNLDIVTPFIALGGRRRRGWDGLLIGRGKMIAVLRLSLRRLAVVPLTINIVLACNLACYMGTETFVTK